MEQYNGKIKQEFLDEALEYLSQYKADKKALEDRILKNIRLYKADYSDIPNEDGTMDTPAASYVFSAIENKYADAVDNFPTANFLEREESDVKAAQILTKVVPAELDMAGFRRAYKDNARRKSKYGTGIYGVFYNEETDALDIRVIDIMNIYCDMHFKDVQDSQFLFIISCIDNNALRREYPKFKELFDGDAHVRSYSGDYAVKDRTEIIDCYYKIDGCVHLMKIAGDTIIDATEDIPGYENGLYAHGKYPVVFDVMYPEDDSPFGLSVIDIIRSDQEYIDKLDKAILKNVLIAAEQRIIVKEGSGINTKDLTDVTKSVIKASGDISEDAIRELKFTSISEKALSHRETKKAELKEIIGNRDFQQGGVNGGVTAASAITVLQSAGEKLSRAMCDDSFDAYKELVIQMVELMREFYSEERIYRITAATGDNEYVPFSNEMLKKQETDAFGFPVSEYKRVEFDIKVTAQRENPFSREANNQTILTLWNSGVLKPENVMSGASTILIQMMNVDGKDHLMQLINNWKTEMEKTQKPERSSANAMPGEELIAVDTNSGGVSNEDLIRIDTKSGEVI